MRVPVTTGDAPTRARALRRAVLALAAVSPAVVLTGCDRPLPAVTLAADGGSVRTEATTWCDDVACSERAVAVPELGVHPGEWVLVGVDTTVAERPWHVVVDGRALPPVSTGRTTYELTAPHLQPGERQVVEVIAPDPSPERPPGRWTLHLVARD